MEKSNFIEAYKEMLAWFNRPIPRSIKTALNHPTPDQLKRYQATLDSHLAGITLTKAFYEEAVEEFEGLPFSQSPDRIDHPMCKCTTVPVKEDNDKI